MSTNASQKATSQSNHQHHQPQQQPQKHTFDSLQEAVSEYLIRHRSVLDIISKFQEANARVNRAVVKAVTTCGCVEVKASRQSVPSNVSLWEIKDHMASHVNGNMCEHCKEVLEQELGRHLFYLAALCDLFELNLEGVAAGECKRMATLGVFNLT